MELYLRLEKPQSPNSFIVSLLSKITNSTQPKDTINALEWRMFLFKMGSWFMKFSTGFDWGFHV